MNLYDDLVDHHRHTQTVLKKTMLIDLDDLVKILSSVWDLYDDHHDHDRFQNPNPEIPFIWKKSYSSS